MFGFSGGEISAWARRPASYDPTQRTGEDEGAPVATFQSTYVLERTDAAAPRKREGEGEGGVETYKSASTGMEQNKMYGSRIPRAPKRALKTLSQNEVNAKGADGAETKLKKPRLALDNGSAGKNGTAEAKDASGLDTEWLEMAEKNNLSVDTLLALKMTGKGKWDHKGRCEQMMPYIRQLRACTRYLRSCVDKADGLKESLVEGHEKDLAAREADLEKLSEKLSILGEQFAESKESVSSMKEKNAQLKKELEERNLMDMDQKVSPTQVRDLLPQGMFSLRTGRSELTAPTSTCPFFFSRPPCSSLRWRLLL